MLFRTSLLVIEIEAKRVISEYRFNDCTYGELWEIHDYGDGFIIYGELSIFRLDREFNIQWTFEGPDVFAIPEGNQPCFVMNENTITLLCWDGIRYTIDYNGNLLSEETI